MNTFDRFQQIREDIDSQNILDSLIENISVFNKNDKRVLIAGDSAGGWKLQ